MSSNVEDSVYVHGIAALSDKGSDTTSQSGETDPELAAIKAKPVDDLPRRRSKAVLGALVFLVVALGLTLGALLATESARGGDEVSNAAIVNLDEDTVNETIAPTDEPTIEQTPQPTRTPTAAPVAPEPDTPEPDLEVNWTTNTGSGIFEPERPNIPLFSVGNFSGLGSVIAMDGWMLPIKAIIGDPSSGCVTVMKQVGGSSPDDMWFWNVTTPPEPPQWEMVGDKKICVEGTEFGAQVSVASPRLGSIDPESVDDIWDEERYQNMGNRFIASNPTTGTVSLYMYSMDQSAWVVTQEINKPDGYELSSFTAEDDTLAISYLPSTTTAMARSFFRSPSDARIDVYEVPEGEFGPFMMVEATAYDPIGADANFVGKDVDTDNEGNVVTLGEDRMIRAYRRESGSFTPIGEPFEPARIFNDDTLEEQDLTIVKCDYIDIILTASIANVGEGGYKTLGIGAYTHINETDPFDELEFYCYDLGLNSDDCEGLRHKWFPTQHVAGEFEPNPSEKIPLIHFDNKGGSAVVATKKGFAASNLFLNVFPTEFDLRFDPDTYESHKVVGMSGLGMVSVMVKSTDGSEEIQTWMMSGC